MRIGTQQQRLTFCLFHYQTDTICNCGAHGHCNVITALCECDLGYYGDSCDVFDYCSYYEDLNNVTACTNGGMYICAEMVYLKRQRQK